MTWFIDWFDSYYYHLLYRNRDEKEAQYFIDNLIKYLQISKKSKLIDVACGKGRHAIYFNKYGIDVVGIDLSAKNINSAKKHETKNLKFEVHDMREEFKKYGFDIATNLFTSFGYFEKNEDNQKAINSMALNLKKEGILIIDFMNVKKVINTLIKSEVKIIDNVTFNIKRNIVDNYITKNIRFSDNGKDYNFKDQVNALTLTDFYDMTSNAGLKIIDVFGNYQLEDFNAISSERLILICKK